MKKLLLLICLVVGSFSVNAQSSCASPFPVTTDVTYLVSSITGENSTACYAGVVDANGDPMYTNWYSFTSTIQQDVIVVTDAKIRSSISAVSGSCSELNCIADGVNELYFRADAMTTYYILFDTYYSTDEFKFQIFTNPCISPDEVDPTNVTETSATLNWEDTGVGSYEVAYGLVDFQDGEETVKKTATNSLNLSDLLPSGNYIYYVRALCGGESTSNWNGPFDLILLKNIPYATGFDNNDELSGLKIQGAWNNTFFLNNTPGNAQSPDNYIVFNNSDLIATDNWMFTPAISLTAGQVINSSFFVYTTSATANRSLKITMGTAPDKATQTTTLYSNTSLNAFDTKDYELMTSQDLIVPTTGIYYFGINDFSAANMAPTSMFFDTFSINTGTLTTNDFVSNQFSVFPNPVKNVLSITNAPDINVSAIAITDLNGRIVKKQSFNNISNITVNVSDLAVGVYMLNITSDKGIATKKIIKN